MVGVALLEAVAQVVVGKRCTNISELKYAVTEYIEYYNSRRISLKLKGLTPIEYRNQTYMPRV
ncbi:IS3 family transposase [Escherichia coli]|nr:IS3 family transposase [Escherichia coli]